MPHVVTSACVDHKYQECVAVCPVEAFREADTYLVIDPDECIDCGVCEPECPADAILQDSELTGSELDKWMNINKKYSNIWPNITEVGEVPADAEEWDGVPDKYENHFSEKPGQE